MKSEETKVIKPEYYVSTSEIPRGTAGYGGGGGVEGRPYTCT